MKYILALLLLICVSANAETTTDAAYGVRYDRAELRLNYLPDDSGKPYVTIFGHGPRWQQVVKSYDSNAELRRLKSTSHFAAIDTHSVLFRDYYAATTQGQLVIRIQDASGNVIHEVVDGNIPLSAEALIRQTNNAQCFRRRDTCPDGNCPKPDTDPEPQPVTPPPAPAPAPKQSFPWFVLGLLTCTGIAIGVVREWKTLYFNRK